MAMVDYYPPITDSTRRSRFNALKAEGYDFMVEGPQTLDDEMLITFGSYIKGVRNEHMEEDLRAIYNQVGSIGVHRVVELSGDFDSARKGGAELLPFGPHMKVREEIALKNYKAKVARTGLWDRLWGNFPDPD